MRKTGLFSGSMPKTPTKSSLNTSAKRRLRCDGCPTLWRFREGSISTSGWETGMCWREAWDWRLSERAKEASSTIACWKQRRNSFFWSVVPAKPPNAKRKSRRIPSRRRSSPSPKTGITPGYECGAALSLGKPLLKRKRQTEISIPQHVLSLVDNCQSIRRHSSDAHQCA